MVTRLSAVFGHADAWRVRRETAVATTEAFSNAAPHSALNVVLANRVH